MIFEKLQMQRKIDVQQETIDILTQSNSDAWQIITEQRRALHKALQELAGYKGRESMKGGREALIK